MGATSRRLPSPDAQWKVPIEQATLSVAKLTVYPEKQNIWTTFRPILP